MKVFDVNEVEIGSFDGVTVKSLKGNVLYRVLDGDVYVPVVYEQADLERFNKGMLSCIGEVKGNVAYTHGEVIIFKFK
ncbi:hypothetical protein [Marinobacter lipolyticus]|uniref:hypothetical protein n=1 Tax=Marinobacter lipolyticus TaxID=209639 RepID=UPI001BCF8140|nr:hypothetical protein [Marinobacter lipolyticus]